jgi:hypothetical protein
MRIEKAYARGSASRSTPRVKTPGYNTYETHFSGLKYEPVMI